MNSRCWAGLAMLCVALVVSQSPITAGGVEPAYMAQGWPDLPSDSDILRAVAAYAEQFDEPKYTVHVDPVKYHRPSLWNRPPDQGYSEKTWGYGLTVFLAVCITNHPTDPSLNGRATLQRLLLRWYPEGWRAEHGHTYFLWARSCDEALTGRWDDGSGMKDHKAAALPEGAVLGWPPRTGGNRPPTVTLTYQPARPSPSDTVVLTANASDPDGDALTYEWYLNGTKQNARAHEVRWENPRAGTHTARVVVSDGKGGTAEASVTFAVGQPRYVIYRGREDGEILAFVESIFVDGRELDAARVSLYADAHVRTGPGVEILVRFANGTLTRVKSDSELRVHPVKLTSSSVRVFWVRLVNGAADFYFGPSAFDDGYFRPWMYSDLEIEMNRAVVSIKGTQLTIEVGPNADIVTVTEGEVEVTDKASGQTTTVRAGETKRFDGTTPPPSDGGNSHTYGGTAGWYLVSTPSAASPHPGVTMWSWNPGTKAYDRPSGLQPERGYWARLGANAQLSVTSPAPTSDVTLNLGVAGWHMISAPWPYPKSAIQVTSGTETKSWADAVAAGWVRNSIYGFKATDGAYTMPTTLHPWYGYWLDAKVAGLSLRFVYASRTTSLDALETGDGPLAPLSPELEDLPAFPMDTAAAGAVLQVTNVPNPITDVYTTTFRVVGLAAGLVTEIRIQVYDLSGKLVWEGSALGPELHWHTDDLLGRYLANGVYLYRVTAVVAGQRVSSEVKTLAIYR